MEKYLNTVVEAFVTTLPMSSSAVECGMIANLSTEMKQRRGHATVLTEIAARGGSMFVRSVHRRTAAAAAEEEESP